MCHVRSTMVFWTSLTFVAYCKWGTQGSGAARIHGQINRNYKKFMCTCHHHSKPAPILMKTRKTGQVVSETKKSSKWVLKVFLVISSETIETLQIEQNCSWPLLLRILWPTVYACKGSTRSSITELRLATPTIVGYAHFIEQKICDILKLKNSLGSKCN